MAYLRNISVPHCQKCHGEGKVELLSWRNDMHGVYCDKHSAAALANLQEYEDRQYASLSGGEEPIEELR